jgi:L-fuconolactonase
MSIAAMTPPVIDAHIHLWDTNRLDYPWLANVPSINRPFLPRDYDQARGGVPVEAMVFVQCECRPDQYREELAWVQSLADGDPRLQAIVPWAPLEDGRAVETALRDMAADPRVKGVRRIIEFEEDLDFCIRPDFIDGVRLLGEVGLHCELTVGPRNFPNVMKLVEAGGETRFILDHIGCPNIKEGRMQPWRDYLRVFAASGPHPCKLSNLVCNADLERWTIDDLRPFADAVIEEFGPDRIIWASDWPHALRASSWQRWFESALELTAGLGVVAQRKIFHDNAKSFYRL